MIRVVSTLKSDDWYWRVIWPRRLGKHEVTLQSAALKRSTDSLPERLEISTAEILEVTRELVQSEKKPKKGANNFIQAYALEVKNLDV